jgi:hypothetical protein
MKYRLLFILLFFSGKALFAQLPLQMDTAFIEGRSFKKEAINELKKNRDFQYDNDNKPELSWWERFWQWFWKWFWYYINQLLKTKEGKTTLWTLFIIFGVSMIVFFVMKVTGMNKDGLFGRNGNSGLDYTTGSDDIHGISFEEAINQAIADGNYRLAIRLLYLQALKKLSDKSFIQWQINKTNSDYLGEVASKPWFSSFRMLTHSFEYTWYGEAQVSEDRFRDLRNQFQQFNNQL